MKFREHRGGLNESMQTVVELPDRAALVAYVDKLLQPFYVESVAERLLIEPYGRDPRIGWEQLYIVKLPGYGVVGFTDGPVP